MITTGTYAAPPQGRSYPCKSSTIFSLCAGLHVSPSFFPYIDTPHHHTQHTLTVFHHAAANTLPLSQPSVVVPSSEYAAYLDIQKRASTVKLLAAFDFVWQIWIYTHDCSIYLFESIEMYRRVQTRDRLIYI